MKPNLIATPAYGKFYLTAEEMKEAWAAGKDFRIVGTSSYLSNRDIGILRRSGYDKVTLVQANGAPMLHLEFLI